MKLSIKSRLFMSFGAIIALIFLIQFVYGAFFADEWYKQYKIDYMEEAFYDIKESYDGDVDTIVAMVNSMEDSQNIRMSIASDGVIIYETAGEYFNEGRHPITAENLGEEEYLIRETGDPFQENNRIEEEKRDDIFPQNNLMGSKGQSEEVITLSGQFEYDGSMIYLTMSLPVSSIESSVRFFTNSYMFIALIVLIIGIFIAILVSQSITKPIREIEKVSSKLARLEFGESASETSSIKEISSLGRSVNQMSHELCARMEDLNLVNEQLKKDVDYQKQMEQMRREFIANVSHEMKTPIAILQFYCSNLKSDIEGLDKEYYYDTIIEETQRMDEMVKSLLDISSLENGLSKMNCEEMNLSEVVEHTIGKLGPLLEEYRLVKDIEQDLIIYGDKKYIEQAIKNYINNASSHTDTGNEIRIELQKIDKKARISVYNEGPSIDEDKIERIWESFYKSDEARVRTNNTNVGLGLYIVKSIVENHNGIYGVENREEGVEFCFSIPLL